MSTRTYNVALYFRLSKEDGDDIESQSITNQRKIVNDYISKFEEYNVYAEYVDDGYSGANFNRPGFQKMLNDINKKLIDIVITKDLSRFGRNYVETGEFIEKIFPDKGVRYIAILDGIDNFEDSAINDFMPLKSVFNEKHCKTTSQGVKKSKRARMKEGIYACNIPPFGYKKDPNQDGKLIIDEEAVKTVRKIFDLSLEGYSAAMIAEYLQKNNYLTPGQYLGNVHNSGIANIDIWKTNTVNRILGNQVYLGRCLRGKTQNISYKSKKRSHIRREDLIVTYNTHEAIVTEEEFHKIHNTKKYGALKTKTRENHLLDGLISCAGCGRNMSFKREWYKYKILCYKNLQSSLICSNNRSVDYNWLENYIKDDVWGMCEQLQKNSKYMDKLYIQYQNKQIEGYKKIIEDLENKITKINSQIASVYSKRLAGELKDEYEENYKNLVQQRKNIEEELSKTKEILIEKKNTIYNVENKIRILKELKKKLKSELNNEDMKKIIDRIEIGVDSILVKYRFSNITVALDD
ncbi:MAG: recombinase family protein [Clostridiales bacterium]|nr:recombinase family protein [Clostridiales bacterium]